MGIPPKYQKSTEGAIASYSYTDIAEGTGKVIFYGLNDKINTTKSYFLTTNTLYSNDINTQAAASGASALILDIDHDIKFNKPQNLKGKVRVNITIGGRTTSAAPNSWNAYGILKLRKWDGTTETEIAQAQTETTSGGGGAINTKESKQMCVTIDASSSVTHFKKGETLRMTIEIYASQTGSGNCGYAHDPQGRADVNAVDGGIIEGTDSTILKMEIPFLLDL